MNNSNGHFKKEEFVSKLRSYKKPTNETTTTPSVVVPRPPRVPTPDPFPNTVIIDHRDIVSSSNLSEQDESEFILKLKKYEHKVSPIVTMMATGCGICSSSLLCFTYRTAEYTWEASYAHYVGSHNFAPNPEFKKFILSQQQ
ncbi:MAG: hypothetical protein AABY22_08245 [Nanoarchaeota archaeon]